MFLFPILFRPFLSPIFPLRGFLLSFDNSSYYSVIYSNIEFLPKNFFATLLFFKFSYPILPHPCPLTFVSVSLFPHALPTSPFTLLHSSLHYSHTSPPCSQQPFVRHFPYHLLFLNIHPSHAYTTSLSINSTVTSTTPFSCLPPTATSLYIFHSFPFPRSHYPSFTHPTTATSPYARSPCRFACQISRVRSPPMHYSRSSLDPPSLRTSD